MKTPGSDCTVVKLPLLRRLVIDVADIGRKRNTMRGLLEVDITNARSLLSQYHSRAGEKPSFTAFVIRCVARALEDDKSIQAFLDWRNRLVVFNDVDVQTMVEADIDGVKTVVPHIVRAANRKSYLEIHDDIRSTQANPRRDGRLTRLAGWFPHVPKQLRRIAYWWIRKRPRLLKKNIGTTIVTSVGMMFGSGGGWGIGTGSLHSFGVLLGSIVKKPGVVDGRIEIREYLHVALSFNHDTVDGAPAARFARRLVKLLESADELKTELEKLDRTELPDKTG